MKVLSYKYILPNEDGVVDGINRNDYMTTQYIDRMYDYLSTIKLEGRCAFLYAGGVLLIASEARNTTKDNYREKLKPEGIAVKDLAAYSMHRWIGSLKGKESIQYANINGNTCASSMYSLYEAEQLLKNGYDQVIIVTEEKTSTSTMRVFDEHQIDIKLGEGMAIIHLGSDGDDITDCKWSYEYNRNPFAVTVSGYADILTDCTTVKPHGTGTNINEAAETKVYEDVPQLRYKEVIGHTQGASGLIEVCMVLDENVKGDILCVSSGMGGFYGSCIVHK